jgi:hypothetical protein
MTQRKWECTTSFCHGLMAAVAAHLVAWSALISLPSFWQFLGHVAGVVSLELLRLGL